MFLFDKYSTSINLNDLKAARVGNDKSLWVPLVEKAWAKI